MFSGLFYQLTRTKIHIYTTTIALKTTLRICYDLLHHCMYIYKCYWITLTKPLSTTSNKLIPLKLSHKDKSPFFGTGTNNASRQSCGTTLLSIRHY